jgi:pimeloyl-ACP methyl ester carboxylesterase
MPFLKSNGIRFYYELSGTGSLLVAFQHGLGGEVSQPQGILGGSTRLRTLSFDCRGHGHTEPLGPPDQLKFSTFADDLRAVLDALGIEVLIVGGISMGAGVALNFALRNPLRVQALILSRPPWLDAPFPPNLEIFRSLSRWLNEGGRGALKSGFWRTPNSAVSRRSAATTQRRFCASWRGRAWKQRVPRWRVCRPTHLAPRRKRGARWRCRPSCSSTRWTPCTRLNTASGLPPAYRARG